MRQLILLAALWALALARPETYREKEDFQFSRSSSDEGSKSGFYGAQRGNMGGNYERAHNMDELAQHQMGGLVRQVNGEIGDSANQRAGSVYTAANTRGVYGSGKYDLTNLEGRNFNEGVSYDNSQSQSSLSAQSRLGQSYQSRSNSNYGSTKSANSNSRYRGQSSVGNSELYASNQRALEELQAGSQYDGSRTSRNQYDASRSQNTGYYSQSGYHGEQGSNQGFYDASGANVQGRLVSRVPVRIVVRPGTAYSVPIATQQFDASQGVSSVDQNSINSEAEALGSHDQSSVQRPTTNSKHYESAYSYRKEWEKHHTQPVTLPTPTAVPYPTNSELYEDINQAGSAARQELSASNLQQSHATHSSAFDVQSSQSRLQSDFNRHYQQAGSNSGSSAYTLNAQNSGASSLNNQVEDLNSKPKSYQSSYAYHKSWERQGDPYVIKPLNNDDQPSQRLSMSNSAYGTQFGVKGQFPHHTHNGVDCDEHGHARVARATPDLFGQQLVSNWETQDDFSQRNQNFDMKTNEDNKWSNLENLNGQQTQDNCLNTQTQAKVPNFGQQSQMNWTVSEVKSDTELDNEQKMVNISKQADKIDQANNIKQSKQAGETDNTDQWFKNTSKEPTASASDKKQVSDYGKKLDNPPEFEIQQRNPRPHQQIIVNKPFIESQWYSDSNKHQLSINNKEFHRFDSQQEYNYNDFTKQNKSQREIILQKKDNSSPIEIEQSPMEPYQTEIQSKYLKQQPEDLENYFQNGQWQYAERRNDAGPQKLPHLWKNHYYSPLNSYNAGSQEHQSQSAQSVGTYYSSGTPLNLTTISGSLSNLWEKLDKMDKNFKTNNYSKIDDLEDHFYQNIGKYKNYYIPHIKKDAGMSFAPSLPVILQNELASSATTTTIKPSNVRPKEIGRGDIGPEDGINSNDDVYSKPVVNPLRLKQIMMNNLYSTPLNTTLKLNITTKKNSIEHNNGKNGQGSPRADNLHMLSVFNNVETGDFRGHENEKINSQNWYPQFDLDQLKEPTATNIVVVKDYDNKDNNINQRSVQTLQHKENIPDLSQVSFWNDFESPERNESPRRVNRESGEENDQMTAQKTTPNTKEIIEQQVSQTWPHKEASTQQILMEPMEKTPVQSHQLNISSPQVTQHEIVVPEQIEVSQPWPHNDGNTQQIPTEWKQITVPEQLEVSQSWPHNNRHTDSQQILTEWKQTAEPEKLQKESLNSWPQTIEGQVSESWLHNYDQADDTQQLQTEWKHTVEPDQLQQEILNNFPQPSEQAFQSLPNNFEHGDSQQIQTEWKQTGKPERIHQESPMKSPRRVNRESEEENDQMTAQKSTPNTREIIEQQVSQTWPHKEASTQQILMEPMEKTPVQSHQLNISSPRVTQHEIVVPEQIEVSQPWPHNDGNTQQIPTEWKQITVPEQLEVSQSWPHNNRDTDSQQILTEWKQTAEPEKLQKESLNSWPQTIEGQVSESWLHNYDQADDTQQLQTEWKHTVEPDQLQQEILNNFPQPSEQAFQSLPNNFEHGDSQQIQTEWKQTGKPERIHQESPMKSPRRVNRESEEENDQMTAQKSTPNTKEIIEQQVSQTWPHKEASTQQILMEPMEKTPVQSHQLNISSPRVTQHEIVVPEQIEVSQPWPHNDGNTQQIPTQWKQITVPEQLEVSQSWPHNNRDTDSQQILTEWKQTAEPEKLQKESLNSWPQTIEGQVSESWLHNYDQADDTQQLQTEWKHTIEPDQLQQEILNNFPQPSEQAFQSLPNNFEHGDSQQIQTEWKQTGKPERIHQESPMKSPRRVNRESEEENDQMTAQKSTPNTKEIIEQQVSQTWPHKEASTQQILMEPMEKTPVQSHQLNISSPRVTQHEIVVPEQIEVSQPWPHNDGNTQQIPTQWKQITVPEQLEVSQSWPHNNRDTDSQQILTEWKQTAEPEKLQKESLNSWPQTIEGQVSESWLHNYDQADDTQQLQTEWKHTVEPDQLQQEILNNFPQPSEQAFQSLPNNFEHGDSQQIQTEWKQTGKPERIHQESPMNQQEYFEQHSQNWDTNSIQQEHIYLKPLFKNTEGISIHQEPSAETITETGQGTEVTEKVSFWKSVENKFSNAKEKVTSWFNS